MTLVVPHRIRRRSLGSHPFGRIVDATGSVLTVRSIGPDPTTEITTDHEAPPTLTAMTGRGG